MAQWVRAQSGQWYNLDQLGVLYHEQENDGTHAAKGAQTDYSNILVLASGYENPGQAQAYLDGLFPALQGLFEVAGSNAPAGKD